METTMELSHETLESIGHYVRNNLGTWLRELTTERDIELRADMNARFQDMHTYSSRWFTVISIVLAALTVAVTVSNFVG